ncbi:oxidoreductase [Lithospermum erythrorhizon]|uniref:Oxidoreductase n=1 Tax=Lithospermum erythrorhizon TaxID=34254 RepID=A0AAV3PNI7_LITER
MQKSISYKRIPLGHGRMSSQQVCYGFGHVVLSYFCGDKSIRTPYSIKLKVRHKVLKVVLHIANGNFAVRSSDVNSIVTDNGEDLLDDDELCPVECVREFKTDEELTRFLEKAKEKESLVVVDFYKTSCGSCKYIEQGFSKLCRGSGDQDAPVIFLKHNVVDEYDEQSEVAERLRIKSVPLFHFYKNGVLLEAFPTRDKERILAAIQKYTARASQDVPS